MWPNILMMKLAHRRKTRAKRHPTSLSYLIGRVALFLKKLAE